MMNLQSASYFLLIPSVLAIIMVSRVHPFPYTETKTWIHHEQQDEQLLENNQLSSSLHHKASRRSSFGGECPDCLSQEEASLRLRRSSAQKEQEREMAFLPPASSSSTLASAEREEQLDYEDDSVLFTGAGDVSPSQEFFQLAQEDLSRSSFSKSSDRSSSSGSLSPSTLSGNYKHVGRRRRIKRSDLGNSSALQQDLSRTFIISRNARDTSTPLTPCLAEREERLSQQTQSSQSSEYIPNCRRDGSFAHVQCHPSTKSCWCVTRNGRPIPGSSVLSEGNSNVRPNCAKYNRRAKSTTRRRSSHFRKNRKCKQPSCLNADHIDDNDDTNNDDNNDDDGDVDSSDDSQDLDDDLSSDDVELSPCNQADWSRFNVALLKTFRSEYIRYRSMTGANSDPESVSDTTVLAWKFDHLDRNKDMILQRNETNSLKNLVKQQIQPRSCAKNFIASCSNGDSQITKSEWLDCLRVSSDVNLPFDTFNSLVDSSTSRGMHPSLLKPVSSSSTSASGSGSVELTPPFLSSGTVGETSEQSNCWTDRQSALASQKQNESIIIPECTANGNYRKVQCAQGKAYCWCVEEESGLQIPNTVVFNTTPDCNNVYSKPMKGCSGAKKHKFLMDLFSTLKSRMAEATRDGGKRSQADIPRNISPEEQASRWYFGELDVNSNGLLDRKEWKTFRNETSLDKRLKKCGKKLPRHCDGNQDKKITMTEWLDCLGVKFLGKVPTASRKRPVNRFLGRGKNPFTTILKQRRRR